MGFYYLYTNTHGFTYFTTTFLSSSNGDLSIFQEGNVKDELENLQKWIDLTDTLNVESNGAPKTLNGWKQVTFHWVDFC